MRPTIRPPSPPHVQRDAGGAPRLIVTVSNHSKGSRETRAPHLIIDALFKIKKPLEEFSLVRCPPPLRIALSFYNCSTRWATARSPLGLMSWRRDEDSGPRPRSMTSVLERAAMVGPTRVSCVLVRHRAIIRINKIHHEQQAADKGALAGVSLL